MQTQEVQPARGAGWRAFAGIMMVIVGFLNLIDAIVAITDANYYQRVANNNGISLPVTNTIHTWGWVELALSIILLIAGFTVLSMGPALISRTIGVVVTGLNLVFHLAYLAHFPFWSFVMIIIDILIIYGLIARVDEYEVP